MDRVATDVAQPPRMGGDLPAFEELLAEGSFQARLAKARAAREKALSQASEAGDDDFILASGTKPWEKPAAKSERKPSSRSTQGSSKAHPGFLALVNPGDAAKGTERPRPKPRQEMPELVPVVPAPEPDSKPAAVLLSAPVVGVPVRSRRRQIQVAAGFAFGLLLGISGAAFYFAPGPQATVVEAEAAIAEQPTGSRLSALTNPVLVAAPSPLPKMEAPQILPSGLAPAILSAPISRNASAPGLSTFSRAAAPALATKSPKLEGGQEALTLAAVLPPLYPKPIARGTAPTLNSLGTGAADRLTISAPAGLPRPDFRAALSQPQATFAGETIVGTIAPTDPLVWPGMAAPQLEPVSLRVDEALNAQPLPPAPAPVLSAVVHIHAPANVTEAALTGVIDTLGGAGYAFGEPTRVGFAISKTNVRFFHASDADTARELATEIGANARDFTSYEPAPPPGTIEVWLAGRSAQSATPTKRKTNRAPKVDPQLVELRNRILQRLLNGEHL
ncbi:MAG: hypothetical protein WBA90_17200 [Albidovulum sp.]